MNQAYHESLDGADSEAEDIDTPRHTPEGNHTAQPNQQQQDAEEGKASPFGEFQQNNPEEKPSFGLEDSSESVGGPLFDQRQSLEGFAGGIPRTNSDDSAETPFGQQLEHKPIFPDSKEIDMNSSGGLPKAPTLDENEEEAGEDSEEPDDSEDDDGLVVPTEGTYDPAEFQHLPVSTEVKDLFQYIGQYRPQTVEIENVLKPFILDYIPAVGDIDAFIKIPRPDEVDDNLGLVVLDEPCAKQSDPTVLDLHLRATTKEGGGIPKETVVKQLDRADKRPKEIEQWIKNISELHKSKPATTVHYTKPMPDIDTLMQEWPPEFEELLKRVELPTADLDVPLETYIDMICGILDIPIHKSRVQSLHVLFTLYSEFKNSQHFKALAEDNRLDNNLSREGAGAAQNTDTLVL